MLEERPQQLLLTSASTNRPANGLSEGSGVIRNVVGQVIVLGVVPDLLIGVKLRSIRWQPLDLDSLCLFFSHPAKFFLQRRLGIVLEDAVPLSDEREF